MHACSTDRRDCSEWQILLKAAGERRRNKNSKQSEEGGRGKGRRPRAKETKATQKAAVGRCIISVLLESTSIRTYNNMMMVEREHFPTLPLEVVPVLLAFII